MRVVAYVCSARECGNCYDLTESLIERAQGVLDWVTNEFRNLESVWKGKVVLILVVSNGGGRSVLETVSQQLPKARILKALFSYRDYSSTGYEGDLIHNPKVVSRLEKLADGKFSSLRST
jgi:hypothetical protein